MTDQQYFTPELSDLFIGYECEVLRYRWVPMENNPEIRLPDREHGPEWVPTVLTEVFSMDYITLEPAQFRTPYLTRQQIEAEGWAYQKTSEGGYDLYHRHESPDIHCLYSERLHRMILELAKFRSDPRNRYVAFVGFIKSVNEFRKICKLAGIEKNEPLKA